MYCFTGMYRFYLRNKISSVFSIIIRPAVHLGNIARPVTVTRIDRRSPLERVGAPGIGASYFPAFENGIEKVEYKHQVHTKYNDGDDRDHDIEVAKFVEGSPVGEVHIPARYTCQSHIVHRPEDKI